MLNTGHFGEIYYAKLQRDDKTLEVAIKMVKNLEDEKDRSDFEREQIIMSKMAHPNIVPLYGLIQDEGSYDSYINTLTLKNYFIFTDVPSIILEYLPNGDLKSFLRVINYSYSDCDWSLLTSGKQASCKQVDEVHAGHFHGNGLYLKNATRSSGKTFAFNCFHNA